jgi:hypothetical protein
VDRTGLGSCPVLDFGSVSAETSGSAARISAVCFCVVSSVKCLDKGKGKDHPITGHKGLEVPNSGYG